MNILFLDDLEEIELEEEDEDMDTCVFYNPEDPDAESLPFNPHFAVSNLEPKKCTCGTESIGGGLHSDWCDKYKPLIVGE